MKEAGYKTKKYNLKVINLFFLRFYLFFRWGREGEGREKTSMCFASSAPPTGDLACNPGTCPDWESNQ